MSPGSPLLSFLKRWDQVLVLALVVIAGDAASTWWLARRAPPAAAAWGEPADRPAPGPDVLDEAMGTALKRAALARGLNPAMLPAMPHLWDLYAQQSPKAASVDVKDRKAVQAALVAFVDELAREQRGAGQGTPGGAPPDGGPPGRPGGDPRGEARPGEGPPGEGPPRPPGGGPVPGAAGPGAQPGGDAGAPSLLPSIEHIDQVRAARLTDLARARGVDPATVLPSAALRQAAVASGDIRSAASQELLEAYRAAMTSLEGGAPAPAAP